MGYQSVFKRYELKYLLTEAQREKLLAVMACYMKPDKFPRATIRNIYFDTDDYRLIRRSIEKPVYKEKLRLRSYGQASGDAPVFVELKKKYQSVVYKRRVVMPEKQATAWLSGVGAPPETGQIVEEIDYFRTFYAHLQPKMFVSYEREAYVSQVDGYFRVTFDRNILFRQEALSLDAQVWGAPLLPEGTVLMELKTPGGIPLWMTEFLTKNRIFKTAFSKYGTAYQAAVMKQRKGEHNYA